MAKIRELEVTVAASMDVQLPLDCTAVRVVTDAATSTVISTYSSGSQVSDEVTAAVLTGASTDREATISEAALGRTLRIVNTGAVTKVIVLAQMD